MSHFTVAVIHDEKKSIDEILAPYDENLKVPRHVRFTRAEAIDYAKRNFKNRCEGMSDDEAWKFMAENFRKDMIDDEGNLYSTRNPNAKWDWYCVGGRWGGSLRLKSGETTDEARIRDVDFSPDEEEKEDARAFWDAVVEGKIPEREDEEAFAIWNPEYYKKYYGDRETYANSMAEFSTHAVVTEDGKWHEKGEMGWFGCSYETPEEAKTWERDFREKFLKDVDPNLLITIVDCHT